jgi:phenylalanine-4-hydroxylase
MKFVSRYQAKTPDSEGIVNYTSEEHATWRFLFHRQEQILPNRAVPEFIEGLRLLNLRREAIPQIPELNEQMAKHSDWQVKPVAAVISSQEFFGLLSEAYFPVATFIRRKEDLDYITEPDIFHEIFGHIPLLTQKDYAAFVQAYAKMALSFPESDWNFFLRLFWFSIEFGLMQTSEGLRIYGGGILSSYGETMSALISDASIRALFDPVSILRTPYRIDHIQPLYFVIDGFSALQDILNLDFKAVLARVRELGMFPSLYKPKSFESNVNALGSRY